MSDVSEEVLNKYAKVPGLEYAMAIDSKGETVDSTHANPGKEFDGLIKAWFWDEDARAKAYAYVKRATPPRFVQQGGVYCVMFFSDAKRGRKRIMIAAFFEGRCSLEEKEEKAAVMMKL